MKTKTLLLVAGTCAFIYYALTRRSRHKHEHEKTKLSDVFKGMTEEMKKPLDEIASEVPVA